jgi:hypothetical protein
MQPVMARGPEPHIPRIPGAAAYHVGDLQHPAEDNDEEDERPLDAD